jgi:hypothetical protein
LGLRFPGLFARFLRAKIILALPPFCSCRDQHIDTLILNLFDVIAGGKVIVDEGTGRLAESRRD